LKPAVFFEQAILDLDDAVKFYTDQSGPELATRYLAALRKATSLLIANPGLGTPIKSRKADLAVRWLPLASPFQKHLMFYRSGAKASEVIRVLHASRNIAEILRETLGYF